MCLILLAFDSHPLYRLVVVANRDEFLARPTAPSAWWEAAPQVLAGRDLKAGGTWMGVTRQGRFAALTNVREPDRIDPDAPSRGDLVADFLTGQVSPSAYLAAIHAQALPYNGYNLLVGDAHNLWYHGNRTGTPPQALAAGVYGLSNAVLDTPWPKVAAGRTGLAAWVAAGDTDPEPLFALMARAEIAPDDQLPATGVPLEWERRLSAAYITLPEMAYGTRLTTVLRIGYDGQVWWEERTFAPEAGARAYEFSLSQAPLRA